MGCGAGVGEGGGVRTRFHALRLGHAPHAEQSSSFDLLRLGEMHQVKMPLGFQVGAHEVKES